MHIQVTSRRNALLLLAMLGALGCTSSAEIPVRREAAVVGASRGCGAAVMTASPPVAATPRPEPRAVGMCR